MFAYVADCTEKSERSHAYGLVSLFYTERLDLCVSQNPNTIIPGYVEVHKSLECRIFQDLRGGMSIFVRNGVL